MEATPGFEPGIRVLQTRALPLGYIAINYIRLYTKYFVSILYLILVCRLFSLYFIICFYLLDMTLILKIYIIKFGAGNGAQTRDLCLGKAALYQLSYSRISFFQSIFIITNFYIKVKVLMIKNL